MIPSWPDVIAVFLAASVFFTAVGLPLARAVAPRGMPPLAMAPALGWAVFFGLALPILGVTGLGGAAIAVIVLAAGAGAIVLWRASPDTAAATIARWTLGLAAIVAVLPMMAIMPKAVPGGLLLAPPVFDHVKIAVVDAILRSFPPVPNPFYGPGSAGQLAYYYLWHFSAAALARGTGAGGWAAEAAMTGFTAFASLMLVIGVAWALGGRAVGALAACVLALGGTARPVLSALMGAPFANGLIEKNADLGGWLNQAAWVPQHLASACCLILAALLILRLATQGGWLAAMALGVVAASGFESSIWIGGVAFAVTAIVVAAMLLGQARGAAPGLFVGRLLVAAALTGVIVLPFIASYIEVLRVRQAGVGMAVQPYGVLGAAVRVAWRPWLDAGAFWLLLVPFSWPALVPLGLGALWRAGTVEADPAPRRLIRLFWLTIAVCLCTAWLVCSTIDNNDLGWRAVLPAFLLLCGLAAGQFAHLVRARRWFLLAGVFGLGALGVPDTLRMVGEYVHGQHPGDAAGFAGSAQMWQALRRHSGRLDRVANNPLLAGAATPWPVNIAWATLSDRPSCFSGWETVIAYGPLTKTALIEANDLFTRVFDGRAAPGDIEALAGRYDCAFAVVARGDGAWAHDPFAGSAAFGLAEQGADFRVYSRAAR